MQEWKHQGEYLQKLREAKRISRTRLARTIGVDPATIARLESGQRVRRRRFLVTAYSLGLQHFQLTGQLQELEAENILLQRIQGQDDEDA